MGNRPQSSGMLRIATLMAMMGTHVPASTLAVAMPSPRKGDGSHPFGAGPSIPFASFLPNLARRNLCRYGRVKNLARRAEIRRAARSRKNRRGW